LNPLKEMLKKRKRIDDAFKHIFKSFTYGKKLLRKKMTIEQKK